MPTKAGREHHTRAVSQDAGARRGDGRISKRACPVADAIRNANRFATRPQRTVIERLSEEYAVAHEQKASRGVDGPATAFEDPRALRGVERRHVSALVLGLRAALVVKEMAAVRQKLRPVLREDLLGGIERRDGCDGPARSGDSGNRTG